MSDELTSEETPVEETTPAQEPEVAADVENSNEPTETVTMPEAEETVERDDEPEDEPKADEETDEVERARIAKSDAERIRAAFRALREEMVSLGISLDESPATPVTPETTEASAEVQNSETGAEETVEVGGITLQRNIADAVVSLVATEVERTVAPLRAEIEQKNEYIEQLLKMPAGKVPAPVVREKFEDEFAGLGNLSPQERIRFGLERLYGDR